MSTELHDGPFANLRRTAGPQAFGDRRVYRLRAIAEFRPHEIEQVMLELAAVLDALAVEVLETSQPPASTQP